MYVCCQGPRVFIHTGTSYIYICHLFPLIASLGWLHSQLIDNQWLYQTYICFLHLLYPHTSNKLIRFQLICGKGPLRTSPVWASFCQTPPRSSGRQLESQIPTLQQSLSGTDRTITPFCPTDSSTVDCVTGSEWPDPILYPYPNSQNPSFPPSQPPKVLLRCKEVSNRIILPTVPQQGPTHPKNSTTQHPYSPSIPYDLKPEELPYIPDRRHSTYKFVL